MHKRATRSLSSYTHPQSLSPTATDTSHPPVWTVQRPRRSRGHGHTTPRAKQTWMIIPFRLIRRARCEASTSHKRSDRSSRRLLASATHFTPLAFPLARRIHSPGHFPLGPSIAFSAMLLLKTGCLRCRRRRARSASPARSADILCSSSNTIASIPVAITPHTPIPSHTVNPSYHTCLNIKHTSSVPPNIHSLIFSTPFSLLLLTLSTTHALRTLHASSRVALLYRIIVAPAANTIHYRYSVLSVPYNLLAQKRNACRTPLAPFRGYPYCEGWEKKTLAVPRWCGVLRLRSISRGDIPSWTASLRPMCSACPNGAHAHLRFVGRATRTKCSG